MPIQSIPKLLFKYLIILLTLLNCGGEDSRVPWTVRRSNQSMLKEISPGCSFGRTDAEAETPILWPTSGEELTHWKRPWWGLLGAGGEGDNRGWDSWMATPTRWAWVWVNSGSWWWTGRPGMLWFMGSQRVRHDWATELNWYKNCNQGQQMQLISWKDCCFLL